MQSLPIRAATALILAETEADQAEALDAYSTGTIRKGLRHLALRFERDGHDDLAREAWALRDVLTSEVRADEVVHFEPDDEFTAALNDDEEAVAA